MAASLISSEEKILGTGNTGSISVTVPSGTDLIVVCICGFRNEAGYFSGGSLTIAGEPSHQAIAGDSDTGMYMGNMVYVQDVAQGSQTLAWDWQGIAAAGEHTFLEVVYLDGIDAADPFGAADGFQQVNNGYTVSPLAITANDIAVCWAWQFDAGTPNFAWTDGTEQSERVNTTNGNATFATQTGSSSAGCTVTSSNNTDGGILMAVFQGTGGAAAPPYVKSDGSRNYKRNRGRVDVTG